MVIKCSVEIVSFELGKKNCYNFGFHGSRTIVEHCLAIWQRVPRTRWRNCKRTVC